MKKELSKMTVAELEREVKRHNRLYFIEHKPEISDYEFDRLVEELKSRKPNSKILTEIESDFTPQYELWSDAKPLKAVRHDIPMLSLDKCYDDKTIEDWGSKFEGDIIASPKIDGCAISLKYDQDGKLVRAATRGDGREGGDITANARFIKDIPKSINLKNVEIRGEVYMSLSVFKRYEGNFANPRNLAAGAINQKDPEKTGDYSLSFWAYDLIGTNAKDEVTKRKLLEKNCFHVVESKLIDKTEAQRAFETFLAKRDKYDFETDGVVYKVNLTSEQERLGSTVQHPRFAIAYKYQGESGETKLIDVEWSVARTGIITPVAIVKPVWLSGAQVSRASLHNVGILRKLKVGVGDKVLMMRRGGVIPNIEEVVESGGKPIGIPSKCPSCGMPTELRDDFLYCTRPKECVQAKIGELKHFVQTTEIDGFGDVLLEKLYTSGLVTDASEFYELKANELLDLERMGETLANKLVANVEAKRELPLDVFLRSLGIREVGKHTSTILAERYGTLDTVMKVTKDELSAIHTIGDVIAEEVVEGLKAKMHLIEKMLRHVKIPPFKRRVVKGGALSGKSVLFTGTLTSMVRSDASKLAEAHGATIASGVSKVLDYLIVGDGGGAGSKLDKAKKLQAAGERVQILTESEFKKMVE